MQGIDRFTRCQLGLLALMWAELEAWVVAIGNAESGCGIAAVPDQAQIPAERIEAFLLELALLYNCPDSFVLRRVMRPAEAVRLRNVVGDVWRLLDVRPFAASRGQVRLAALCAQDRLFDELRSIALAVPRAGDAGCATAVDLPERLQRGTEDDPAGVRLARA